MELVDSSRIGIIGGGPAGSLSGYFFLKMARSVAIHLEVDIYEPKDYSCPGPECCNMCGGVISESLVRMLALEGIKLPPSVVQRQIDSYVLHTDQGQVQIRTPKEEMRIAALFRGSGPKGCPPGQIESFDGFLLNLAVELGAKHIQRRVQALGWENAKPLIRAGNSYERSYDLVVGAVGVNSVEGQLFKDKGFSYQGPKTTRTGVLEFYLGPEKVQECLGNSMHLFLLDIPRFEFAALIPKGGYVTACLLGHEVDLELMNRFMNSPEVRSCLPEGFVPDNPACQCLPRINLTGGKHIYSDRIVMVGDFGVTRLFKDGIGAAFHSAKACVTTALFKGISKKDFDKHYWPTIRRLERDNRIGKLLFASAFFFRRMGFLRRAMLQMARKEQKSGGRNIGMSMVLWNMFTGSTPYQEILLHSLRPDFIFHFSVDCFKALFRNQGKKPAVR